MPSGPWLGGDIATSFLLSPPAPSSPNRSTYLWLHGDTLYGSMTTSPGPGGGPGAPTRNVTGMPRNSVALLSVDASTGAPASPFAHYLRPASESNPVHYGLFSPPQNDTQYYWPTAGAVVGAHVHVLGYRMENSGGGLFPFQTAAMDVIRLPLAGLNLADPLSWPSPLTAGLVSTLPFVGAEGGPTGLNFSVGNAVTYDSDSDTVLLLGGFGPTGPGAPPNRAMLLRIPGPAFDAAEWAALEVWAAPSPNSSPSLSPSPAAASPPSWVPFASVAGPAPTPGLLPFPLFDFVPSETTLTPVPALYPPPSLSAGVAGAKTWAVVVANTFLSSSIMIRTAPDPTGPWSDLINVYQIPAEMLAGGAFCYAGKMHPELSPGLESQTASFVFSFMCNTPTIPELLNRTDVYVPRLIRTQVTWGQ